MSLSEYTMSEIVASVYETMEATGKTEGILFLDEINCVSETLAPSILAISASIRPLANIRSRRAGWLPQPATRHSLTVLSESLIS